MAKFKRCKCSKKSDCPHPWWAKVRRPAGQGEVRVSLEKHFGVELRGRGSARRADDLTLTLTREVKSSLYDDQKRRQALHGLTMDQLMDRYQREHLDGLRSGKHEARKLAEFRRLWGNRHVNSMNQGDFTLYARELERRTKSGAGVRRPFARLSHMFGWAVAHGICDRVPYNTKALNLRSEDPPRGRLPTEEELDKILSVATPYLRDWIEFKLDTGLRSGTMRQLRFEHVDWAMGANGSLVMPRDMFKNRKRMRERVVVKALTERAREVLVRRARLVRDASAAIFGNEDGTPYTTDTMRNRMWRNAVRQAGFVLGTFDLHEHDLRAESASRVMRATGGRVDMVKQHLGNTSLGATEGYIRAMMGQSEAIAELLDAARAKSLEDRPAVDHQEPGEKLTERAQG